MDKKIKVIELYQRLAKQENMPDKIKYCNNIYHLCIDSLENVFYYETNKGFQLMITINSVQALNREVEILEDEEEIDIQGIRETEIKKDKDGMEYYEYENGGYTESGYSYNYSRNDIETRKIINQLIRGVKKLDKKIN